jgi:hypothetical protein
MFLVITYKNDFFEFNFLIFFLLNFILYKREKKEKSKTRLFKKMHLKSHANVTALLYQGLRRVHLLFKPLQVYATARTFTHKTYAHKILILNTF